MLLDNEAATCNAGYGPSKIAHGNMHHSCGTMVLEDQLFRFRNLLDHL